MSKTLRAASWVLLGMATAYAQTPTGTILGTITDQSGAVVPNAKITITDKATGATRSLESNEGGLFSAPALPAGQYQVRGELQGFRVVERDAEVLAGSNTTVNLEMSVGGSQEVVTVEAATAQINYEANTIQGVIPRQTIQELPLNGRNFMQLSALEPGIIVAPVSGSTQNYPFTVSILGGNALKTVFTVDGMDIDDDQQGGTGMNITSEVIQEFQVSALNYDMTNSTGAQGAVNVVTRSGTNDFHASAFFFFRDHNLAAYPALKRSTIDPNPFFARRNPGVSGGGPIIRNKLFFFGTFETTNQVSATIYQPDIAAYAPLTSIKNSPARTKFASIRYDYRLSDKHSLFARYSHDGNHSTGAPGATTNEPSAWANNSNWSDQAVLGVTSILTPTIVNDLRFGFWIWHNWAQPLTLQQCDTTCPGGEIPGLSAFGQYYFNDYMPGLTTIGSSNSQMGQYTNTPNVRLYRRPQVADNVSWQKGTHRLRFGADWTDTMLSDHYWGFSTPLETEVETITSLGSQVSPAALAAYFPTLPTTVSSTADLLNEPNYNISSAAYGVGVGAGIGQTVAPYHRGQHDHVTRPHGFFSDTWKVTPRFTLNYGLSYEVDFGLFNSDMPKPAYLVPILGSTQPTNPNLENFSPSFGFAWGVDKSGKTVIRGGAGIYWDTINQYYHWREEAAIGPLGNGRFILSPNAFINTYPGIYNFAGNPNGTPLPVGSPLPLNAITNMTLGQYLNLVIAQLGTFLSEFNAFGPYQTTGAYTASSIQYTKQGYELDLPSYPQPRAYQTSIGVQRDLGHNVVATVDYARRLTVHQVMPSEVDYNEFSRFINGVQTPVIPKCSPASYSPGPECSNGPITVWDPNNRAVYNAMLVKVSKRLSNHYQFVASYAYQSSDTVNALINLNSLFGTGYGDVLARHNLNISGLVDLPWGFSLTVNSSILSRTPVAATLAGIDLSGTGGPSSSTLPGIPYDCLNDGCSKSRLAAAVASFNATYAGTKTPNGTTIPSYVLPPNYQFGSPTYAQDFRLTKVFSLKERYKLNVFAEMFNAFNIANLTGYSFNLDRLSSNPAAQTYSFGQPTTRANGTFGSGGPRAVQVGARFVF